MSPIIVLSGGKLRAVVGASGGPLIVSSVFQTLLRIMAECGSPFEAVSEPRYHHQVQSQVSGLRASQLKRTHSAIGLSCTLALTLWSGIFEL